MAPMMLRVRDGRLVLDEEVGPPQEMQVERVSADGRQDLDDAARRRLGDSPHRPGNGVEHGSAVRAGLLWPRR